MMIACAYCFKHGTGVCFSCLRKLFPEALEALRRACKHDYELSSRDHQTDSYPVSMTDTVIRSKVEAVHLDTLICRLCGDKWETDSPCECD
jgi:hypothetical protein